jgi:hypothetical protein
VRRCEACGERKRSDRFRGGSRTCSTCLAGTFQEQTRDVPLSPGHALRVALKEDGGGGRLVFAVVRLEPRGGHVALGRSLVLQAEALPALLKALEELAE